MIFLYNNIHLTLHLSTISMKDNPKMRKRKCVNKRGCLCPPQKGKYDYMNTKEYRLLGQQKQLILTPKKRLMIH